MKQFREIKASYPDTLLLFRVGDFYELFGDDAVIASKILDIVQTHRKNGAAGKVELAGFPYHSLDSYLPKLVRAGQRVAVCEQLEDPKNAKGIVKRGVKELVTPGVSANDKTLDSKSNNFLASIYELKNSFGVALTDLSTGEFLVAQGNQTYIEKLIKSIKPTETIISKNYRKKFTSLFGDEFYIYPIDPWFFDEEYSKEQLFKHFKTETLKGFGISHMDESIVAAGAIIHYLNQNHHIDLEHINSVKRIDEQEFVWIDSFTLKNLEIIESNHPNGIALLEIIDQTLSPMGSRLMRNWLLFPLLDLNQISYRQEAIEYILSDDSFHNNLNSEITKIGDLERIIGKVALRRINPRELLQLSSALKSIQKIQNECQSINHQSIQRFSNTLNENKEIIELIDSHISTDAPVIPSKGGIFNSGVNEELDEYLSISKNSKDHLIGIKNRESELTGISSLKLAFNNVFGYYLEVTNTHKDKVPEHWIRKQTLVNAERYITPELKEFEEKILLAESKITEIETQLFSEFVNRLIVYVTVIQSDARLVAEIDCLNSLAHVAKKNNYSKPSVTKDFHIAIKDGRHPVIEKQLPLGEDYIPNDIYINQDDQQIIILTGPNMSGKSALLRQTALIVVLSQIGSYVPARHAEIGLVDKVYTRVGASDNISQGESTFMVEMVETASILNNLSDRSLVILDEIGRGTSTYDGVSLAWSIVEFMNNIEYKPKTLFATHYHELNQLENLNNGIVNYHISTEEKKNKVIFLRKIKKGGSENSFGIHVARMAGIPKPVVKRANQILIQLEKDRVNVNTKGLSKKTSPNIQMNLFQLNDPKTTQIINLLNNIDVNTLTPVESLMKLNEIKQLLEN
ncbi:MAG: DNA mismatch repair protein MutS [Bacteroidia bacterium]|nr:DNA mismatch repair protein MutS [Bacteroidia bacterium]